MKADISSKVKICFCRSRTIPYEEGKVLNEVSSLKRHKNETPYYCYFDVGFNNSCFKHESRTITRLTNNELAFVDYYENQKVITRIIKINHIPEGKDVYPLFSNLRIPIS